MSQASTEIVRISGHAGPAPGAGLNREYQVCKLVDTTTCIGCKACEVACLEWNGYPFTQTSFDNTYQTMPETAWNYWNLIKFNEHEDPDHGLMLLMRKDQCMHCEEPGCLAACPADGAIVQYANGIVDFQEANCIGCGYCITGCPFNIPKFSPKARKVFKCTLCNDRVTQGLEPACIKACPTGCLHFGTKPEMKELAENARGAASHAFGFRRCGRLRSGRRGRHARHLCLARCSKPGTVWRPAERSAHSVVRAALEEAAEMARQCGDDRWVAWNRGSLFALWTKDGRNRRKPEETRAG